MSPTIVTKRTVVVFTTRIKSLSLFGGGWTLTQVTFPPQFRIQSLKTAHLIVITAKPVQNSQRFSVRHDPLLLFDLTKLLA